MSAHFMLIICEFQPLTYFMSAKNPSLSFCTHPVSLLIVICRCRLTTTCTASTSQLHRRSSSTFPYLTRFSKAFLRSFFSALLHSA